MLRTSDRMRGLMAAFPMWVRLLGGALLIAELIVGLRLATGDARPITAAPPARALPTPSAAPIDTPTPASAVPTPSPSSADLAVTRIPEGTVATLPRHPGRGSKVIGRVTDPKTGLSFAELGAPWRRSRPIGDGPVKDGRYNLRQTLRTESYGPDEDRDWWADIDSQHLWSELDAGDSLYDAARALLDDKQRSAFPAGTTGEDIASQPVRRGWLLARMMRMPPSPDGREASRELSVSIAVDTGRPRPAVLWITIPDTHEHLWPDVRTLMKSLKVMPV
ncbi:hypothetical protein SAMN05444920_109252 [Nonomuraea solani]|uniref:Uncharacterized protein n=1 Tax=Nonomuraea solani TaxID=1144553 RepID=A0A1H6EGF7_9ACTN|nr:hypothetical protein [Nonomuraea solani]SEG96029.1 hypothetical protein SAMN05444920_109252 [Nonomuraea solani]